MTDTIYNGGDQCPKCGILMTPVEKLFSGKASVCPECRNELYRKNAKAAMSGER
jgi:uncharacterized paraquat-inducible protein A